ncbi:MAG TPA: hypothetical protein PLY93_06835, partial [Turneriella sp.]|nr:hypothetical protein [Turneriella sp.]
IDEFVLGFKQLLNTLPAALRENLGAQLTLLNPGRELKVSGETHVTVAGETVIAHETKWALPDIHIDDIRVKAKARLVPVATYIDEFSITGLKGALRVGANGALKKGSEVVVDEKTKRQTRVATTIPNLRYSVELSQKKENEILEGTHLVGAFTLSGTARGNIVDGKIGIDDLSVRNPKVKIQNVNLDFPFKHDLKLNKTLNLRAGNKERIIKNYNFNRAYNFSIAGIDISDPNNKREWLKIVYPRGNYPAVGASMEYKDNVFVMPVMQMYTLNGVVTISDTLFNLGRLRPKEMEYSSTIQIKDIDLKQLLPSDKAETITDGKLRIDMLFTGNRLDKPIENLNGYISIFRIGPEFADTVMKAVMPKSSSIVTTLAANTTIPKNGH